MKRKQKEAQIISSSDEADDEVVVVINSSDESEEDDNDYGYSLVKGSGQYKSLYDFTIVSNPDYLENGDKPRFFSIEGLTSVGKELFACGMCFSHDKKTDSKVGSRSVFGPIKEWAIEYRFLPVVSILIETSPKDTEWIELISPTKEYFHIFNSTYQTIAVCHALINLVQRHPKESYESIIEMVGLLELFSL